MLRLPRHRERPHHKVLRLPRKNDTLALTHCQSIAPVTQNTKMTSHFVTWERQNEHFVRDFLHCHTLKVRIASQCECTAQWQRINELATTTRRRHDDEATTRRRRHDERNANTGPTPDPNYKREPFATHSGKHLKTNISMENRVFLVGDTYSNGCFFHYHVSFTKGNRVFLNIQWSCWNWVRPWSFRPKNHLEGSERKKLQNFSLCSPQASQPQSGNKYHEIPHLLLLSSSKLPQYPCLDRICWNHPSFSRCSFQPHVATSSIWVQKKSHTPKKSVYLLNHFEIYIPSGKLTWQWENGTFWRCISLLKTRWFSSQPFWVLTIQPAPFPGCLDDVSAFAPGPCRSKEWDIPQANLVEKKMEHIWGHHEKKTDS